VFGFGVQHPCVGDWFMSGQDGTLFGMDGRLTAVTFAVFGAIALERKRLVVETRRDKASVLA
jgi:hypothetical protein